MIHPGAGNSSDPIIRRIDLFYHRLPRRASDVEAASTGGPLTHWEAYGVWVYGARVASTDLDDDGVDEILTMPGSDPGQGLHLRAWIADGPSLSLMNLFDADAYGGLGLTHGGAVAGGRLY